MPKRFCTNQQYILTLRMDSKEKNKLKHIAIIMDGNNRWASDKNLPGVAGHKKGVERARESVEYAVQRGLSTLTLFAFSSENWGRSSEEVNLLMQLLNNALQEEVPNLIKNSVQLSFIGDLSQFDQELIEQMKESEKLTYCDTGRKKLDLVVAASYGGRWDIVNAINKHLDSGSNKELTEKSFDEFLSTSKFTDPDLCIRTGNELRISNFLLWQSSYTEIFFVKKLWPDFNKSDFRKIILKFK